MVKIVGVQFAPVSKIYDFLVGPFTNLQIGDYVVVETSKGLNVGRVIRPIREIPHKEAPNSLKPVVRIANAWDLVSEDQYGHKEAEVIQETKVWVKKHNLHMKLVSASYNFDGGYLTIYFTAAKRVDFRMLVKDLARVFHTRIEMRQIGERDETKMIGGIGRCGRELCCSHWKRDFQHISIRTAKLQNLPLDPSEITGVCGKLMCCLAYEVDTYKALSKRLPHAGSRVNTKRGKGKVKYIKPLKETFTVWLEEEEEMVEMTVEDLESSPHRES